MPSPLSHAQQRLFLGEAVSPGGVDNKVVGGFLLRGALRIDELRAALRDVVDRHAMLRTLYRWDGDRGVATAAGPAATAVDFEVTEPVDPCLSSQVSAVAADICADWWELPFDLQAGPVLRGRLVPLGDDGQRHLFCLGLHHIAFDGWSGTIFRSDLATAYAARCAATVPDWPPLPSYQEYVTWERRELAGWVSADLPYWRRVFSEPVDAVLTCDPGLAEAEARGYETVLPAEAVTRLRENGRRLGGTPLSLLLCGVGDALMDWSGAQRIGMASVVSGRWEPRFQAVIGCFVNPFALTVDRSPGDDLPTRLAGLTRSALDGLRHARLPVDELASRLAAEAEFSFHRDAVVVLNARHSPAPLGAGVEIESVPVPPPRTGIPLSVETVPRADGGWQVRARWRRDSLSDGRGQELVESVTAFLLDVSQQ